MSDGFTLSAYADLLDAVDAGGYEALTVRDYLTSDNLPKRFVVFRHDVDRLPRLALRMARLEAEYGVKSTYYYRTTTFDPEMTRLVAKLGHEVGYHYEDYVQTDGDLSAAHRRFQANLEQFREQHTEPIETVCMHGNPLSPHDNREMWTTPGAPDPESYGLYGEAYLSMDFVDVTYFSDTGRTWQDGTLKVKDHTMGEGDKQLNPDATAELAALFRNQEIDRACVLAHPERWANSWAELVALRSADEAVNLVKRGMALLNYGAADA